jgi:hypothetical protein
MLNAGTRCLHVVAISLALVGLVWGQPSSANAQDLPPESETGEATVAENASEAWSSIMEFLDAGNFEAAERALADFRTTYAADPRTRYADAIRSALRDTLGRPDTEAKVTGQAGRVGLAAFSTLWGAGSGALIGFEIAAARDREGLDTTPIWTAVGGAGLGLGLSLALTSDRAPTRNQASVVSSAGVWGYALGAELAFGTPISSCSGYWCDPSPHAARLVPLSVSSLAVLGAALYARARPDVPMGDVALVNAGGAWGFITGMSVMAIGRMDSLRRPADMMLAGTAVGLATGLTLSPFVTASRSRIWIINMSGALGAGLGLAVAATAGAEDERAWGVAALVGQTVGLATGALLTKRRASRRGDP